MCHANYNATIVFILRLFCRLYFSINIYADSISNIQPLEPVILGGYPGAPLEGKLKNNISFTNTSVSGIERKSFFIFSTKYIKLQRNASGGDSGSPVISPRLGAPGECCIGILSKTVGTMDYAETCDTIRECLKKLSP